MVDRNRVVDGCPWSFEKNLLVLSPIAANENPQEVNLDWAEFHTHVHGLPLSKMSKEMAVFIGNHLGKFVDVDMDDAGHGRTTAVVHIREVAKLLLSVRLLGSSIAYCECEKRALPPPYGPWLRATNLPSGRNRNSAAPRNSPQFSSPSPKCSQNPLSRTHLRGASVFGSFSSPAAVHSPSSAPTEHSIPLTHHSIVPDPLQSTPTLDLPSYPNFPSELTIHAPLSPAPEITHQFPSVPSYGSTSFSSILSSPLIFPFTHITTQTTTLSSSCPVLKPKRPRPKSRSGGLALLWHKSLSVQLQSFGHHHIDATVYPESETEAWRFTGFYGFADVACRQRSWDLLSTLKNQSRRAWLIAGDFNEILDDSEKRGGRPRPLWQVRRFREALAQLMFMILVLRAIRLLGVTVTRSLILFLNDLIELVPIPMANFPNTVPGLSRPFRFEASWTSSADCEQVIREGWNAWAGNGQIRLREKDLENIRLQPISAASKLEESKIRADIEQLLSKEELSRRTNDITRIKNGDGQWLELEEEIRDHIETYFGEIFRSRNPSEEELEKGTEAISGRLSEQLRQELSQPYTAEEISKALSQMAPLKSPGPDGMPPFFFQKYWHIVKTDVISATLALLNELILPPGLNHTHIALIPKCKKPETLTQFRPISLCNVVYKIASKTIANRLKPLLDSIISPCQAAFVPGRLITDNVLLAFEFGSVIPQRGLRQGDPLSPYLFLLCTEAFSALLQREERGGRLQGVAVCRRAPRVSHLLFADDTLIFCQAKVDAALCILEVLDNFGRAAGQEINFAKSSVVFSRNTVASLGTRSRAYLTFEWKGDMTVSRPTLIFGGITARLGKLTGSAGGNSASPKFRAGWVFVTFKHLIWLCFPNNCGGSFRSRIVYFAEFFERDISQTDMFFRHRLDEILPTLGAVSRRPNRWCEEDSDGGFVLAQFGFGEIPGSRAPSLFLSFLRQMLHSLICVSVTLSMPLRRSGITVSFASCFGKKISMLSSLFPSASSMGGLSIWHHTHNGLFSVRSAYHVALSLAHQPLPSSSNLASPVWKTIWKANVPSKIRVFIWKVAHNALPTGRNLLQKLRFEPLACPLCCSEDEDVEHVFLRCPFARQVWALSHLPWALISVFSADSCGWVEHLAKSLPTEDFDRFLTICWVIWWNRNRALMERRFFQADELLSFALNYLTSFQQVSVSPGGLPQVPSPSRWSPPERSVVKLNFDGATFASSSEFGIGVIARNSFGECIGWKAVRKKGLHKPEMVEAFAAVKQFSSPVDSVGRRLSWKVTVLISTSSCLRLNLTARTQPPLFGTLNP
ncbi:UNVERIFIED_CONTAM: putative mitochondrial protein [Sesamum calycinum]|uniref:Mitochondrial protein n=1 Tax=Sesamum calycinum TaxID=2727403 RepID=A0AAW2SWQ3_9LAMI